MSENMSFLSALELSVVAMLIVFVLLYAISLVLSSFSIIFKEKSSDKKVSTPVKPQPKVVENVKGITFDELEKDEDMLVAAMVASMEASGENKNSNFRIVRIKQI